MYTSFQGLLQKKLEFLHQLSQIESTCAAQAYMMLFSTALDNALALALR